jgi:hypothetical protein
MADWVTAKSAFPSVVTHSAAAEFHPIDDRCPFGSG